MPAVRSSMPNKSCSRKCVHSCLFWDPIVALQCFDFLLKRKRMAMRQGETTGILWIGSALSLHCVNNALVNSAYHDSPDTVAPSPSDVFESAFSDLGASLPAQFLISRSTKVHNTRNDVPKTRQRWAR